LREQFINKGIEIMNGDCLFCKIVNGDINADVVFESENVMAFNDINPQAPTHILIIPKRHIPTINDLIESDCDNLGQLFLVAASIAKKNNFSNEGYRVVMNCNSAAGQTVFHLHLHLLGGRTLMWPPG
tara:strand:+ start:930 stop:1313 length:384 start_codon:yes stop_codon:yes gene_type:complete